MGISCGRPQFTSVRSLRYTCLAHIHTQKRRGFPNVDLLKTIRAVFLMGPQDDFWNDAEHACCVESDSFGWSLYFDLCDSKTERNGVFMSALLPQPALALRPSL